MSVQRYRFIDFANSYNQLTEKSTDKVKIKLNGKKCQHFVERFESRVSSDLKDFDAFLTRLPTLIQQHKSRILSVGSKLAVDSGEGDYTIHYLKNHSICITLRRYYSIVYDESTILMTFTTIKPTFQQKF